MLMVATRRPQRPSEGHCDLRGSTVLYDRELKEREREGKGEKSLEKTVGRQPWPPDSGNGPRRATCLKQGQQSPLVVMVMISHHNHISWLIAVEYCSYQHSDYDNPGKRYVLQLLFLLYMEACQDFEKMKARYVCFQNF